MQGSGSWKETYNLKHLIFTGETWVLMAVEIGSTSEKAKLMSMLLTNFNYAAMLTPKICEDDSCKVYISSHRQLVCVIFSFLFCCMADLSCCLSL